MKRFVTLLAIIVVATSANTYLSLSAYSRLNDQHTEAIPHLVAAMSDIIALVTPPSHRGIPKGEERAYAIAADMRAHLTCYVDIEHQLPIPRSC